jgi:hypothetical protein
MEWNEKKVKQRTDFILNSGETIKVCYSLAESDAVKIAITNLKKDLHSVANIQISDSIEDGSIVIGSIGVSDLVEQYIDVTLLKDEQGNWIKEAYLLKVCDGKLIIAGSDRRGTIYGIYEFCEMIGVSPWYYWADVPVKQKESIRLEKSFERMDYPSVEYRGIFINDEEELEHWAQLHMGEPTIGLNTYDKIFELLLRLKGNYIWPAMHVNSFNMEVENGALANRMGIVVGTSHCDMLMRSNNREWIPWTTKKGYTDVEYDYSIEGKNREALKEYWRESVEQNQEFEVSYTLGMRGIHDSGFETKSLTGKSEDELRKEKIALLQLIMKDQQNLLADTLGHDTLKIFVPYKEVLELYDHGLNVPEDITLIWSNDNYGYIRRYPSMEEQKRSGGNGIYYHNSYWAPPGRSYLFISSIPIAQTKYELEKAYENGIKKLWVMNVGAMKPLEQEIEFYLRLAWEIGKSNKPSKTSDVEEYLADWIDRNFSGSHGKVVAGILNDFAQVTNVRKIENLEEDVFSQTAYGDEATVRMNQLKSLFEQGNAIYEALPKTEQAAFFQLVLMKVHATYYTNAMYYFADRSNLCIEQGKMRAAGIYTDYSKSFDDLRRRMLIYYNDEMLDGKWKGIVTPEDFPPPRTAMYPACTPPFFHGDRKMLITTWNDEKVLQFVKPGTKWFEIANGGVGNFDYVIDAEDWIELSHSQGSVTYETRIMVSIKDTTKDRSGKIIVRNITDQTSECIEVSVSVNSILSDLKSQDIDQSQVNVNIQDDGIIVVQADTQQVAGYRQIKRLGRGGGNLMEAQEEGVVLTYPVYLTEDSQVMLEVHRYPSLNSIGRIRVKVAMDNGPSTVLESEASDEWRSTWADNTMNHVDKLYLQLPSITKGLHYIHFTAVDQYFAFTKFVLYSKSRKENNLGTLIGNQNLLGDLALENANSLWYGRIELKPRPTLYADVEIDHNTLTIKDTIVATESYAKTIPVEKILEFGKEVYQEKQGRIKIDVIGAYMQTAYAYTRNHTWQYCNSESYGRSGLAMHIRERGLRWKNRKEAPSLNYKIHCDGGTYRIWILAKFNSRENADVYLSIDGIELTQDSLYNRGNLWRYEAEQAWRWIPVSFTKIEQGDHLLTISVGSSRIRFDRIFMTKEDEKPPLDNQW